MSICEKIAATFCLLFLNAASFMTTAWACSSLGARSAIAFTFLYLLAFLFWVGIFCGCFAISRLIHRKTTPK